MEISDILNAYVRIREIDNTIPDDVLDFMKDAAIEKLKTKPEPPKYQMDVKFYKEFPHDTECDKMMLFMKNVTRRGHKNSRYTSIVVGVSDEEKDDFLEQANNYEEFFKIIGVHRV